MENASSHTKFFEIDEKQGYVYMTYTPQRIDSKVLHRNETFIYILVLVFSAVILLGLYFHAHYLFLLLGCIVGGVAFLWLGRRVINYRPDISNLEYEEDVLRKNVSFSMISSILTGTNEHTVEVINTRYNTRRNTEKKGEYDRVFTVVCKNGDEYEANVNVCETETDTVTLSLNLQGFVKTKVSLANVPYYQRNPRLALFWFFLLWTFLLGVIICYGYALYVFKWLRWLTCCYVFIYSLVSWIFKRCGKNILDGWTRWIMYPLLPLF